MKKTRLSMILAAGCVFFLLACGDLPASEPEEMIQMASPTLLNTETPIPTATETSVPTLAPTITITPTPSPETITAREHPGYAWPFGEPVEIWEEIPIMPETIHGLVVYKDYWYSVERTISEVREFYEQELDKLDYRLSAIGETDMTITLVFDRGSDQITVTAFGRDQEYQLIDQDVDDGKFKIHIEIPEFHGSDVLIEK